MKTLLIVQGAPYPPRRGSPLRSWQLINLLATRGPVHVRSYGLNEANATEMPIATTWSHVGDEPKKRFELFDNVIRLVFAREYPLRDVLRKFRLNSDLAMTIAELRPELIVVSNWHNALPATLQKRAFVLDAHNIESTLAESIWLAANQDRLSLVQRFLLERWKGRERRMFRAAKLVMVPSSTDARDLETFEPNVRRCIVWPNAVDVEYYSAVAATVRTYDSSPALVYVGSFAYPPNAVAAVRLISSIMPMVRRRFPNATLALVGIHPTDQMRELAATVPGVTILGEVPDVRPWLARANVTVIPISEGGGTRLKILESFAAKLPVISTAKGIEGVDALSGLHYIQAETTPEFISALERLEDESFRRDMVDHAYELVVKHYSWHALVPRLEEIIA